MRFAVRFLRYRGRVLPWRDVMNQGLRTGDLRVEECLDDELRRYVRTARLVDVDRVVNVARPPELLDARLIAMSPQAFTLTGFERDAGAEYAQSWLVTEPAGAAAANRTAGDRMAGNRAAGVSVLPPPSPGRRLLQENTGAGRSMRGAPSRPPSDDG